MNPKTNSTSSSSSYFDVYPPGSIASHHTNLNFKIRKKKSKPTLSLLPPTSNSISNIISSDHQVHLPPQPSHLSRSLAAKLSKLSLKDKLLRSPTLGSPTESNQTLQSSHSRDSLLSLRSKTRTPSFRGLPPVPQLSTLNLTPQPSSVFLDSDPTPPTTSHPVSLISHPKAYFNSSHPISFTTAFSKHQPFI